MSSISLKNHFGDSFPDDLIGHISSFLDGRDIVNFQTSSAKIYKIVSEIMDRDCDHADLRALQKVKRQIWFKIKAHVTASDLYEKLRDDIDAAQKELRSVQEKLYAVQVTWLGWLVNLLSGKRGFLLKIHDFCIRYFSCFKHEEEIQNKIRAQQTEITEKLSSLLTDREDYWANRNEFLNSVEDLHLKAFSLKGKELIMNLFGGAKSFAKYPELDIGNREGFASDYMDIRPEEMVYSLMRGRDMYGRLFFAIKDSYEDVHTFLQENTDNFMDWSNTIFRLSPARRSIVRSLEDIDLFAPPTTIYHGGHLIRSLEDNDLFDPSASLYLNGCLVNVGKINIKENSYRLEYYALRALIQKGETTYNRSSSELQVTIKLAAGSGTHASS